MVVDGKLHASGNWQEQVETNIDRARDLKQGRVAVTVTRISDGQVRIQIPGSDALYRGEADIMLVRFDEKHVTDVTLGENKGKTLINHNVVRLLRPVADWNGEAVDMVMRLQDIGGADRPTAPSLFRSAARAVSLALRSWICAPVLNEVVTGPAPRPGAVRRFRRVTA